ncbi:putative lipase [Nocardia nova SH22a]|uniref:Putative lipase n=1 Tax=Nocardia nova SH22a TaxID=1415166 RepID=W5T8L5_9NOCA|nr:lipase family protein [Nocardia nova]AHH15318.1 putative lipase [Nocardia nova SH22a]
MKRGRIVLQVATAAAAISLVFGAGAGYAPDAHAASDSFYTYSGSAPLDSIAPGTVLQTRTIPYHMVGIPLPITAVQLQYRTNDAQERPTANITTVLLPPGGVDPAKAVAYQSYYDSLNPEDGPSRSAAGVVSLGDSVLSAESPQIVPLLAQGYTVIIADTEGQTADFAAGPEYGMATLDSIRAATHSPEVGLNEQTRIALMGYSGGAIATNWAAALAPAYAPEVNSQLVGAAEGGLLVNPARNLKYLDGSFGWAGVAAMAIIGVGRSYGIDFSPYLNDYGQQIVNRMDQVSIANVLFQYPGLTWPQLVKPQYADPRDVPPFVEAVRKVNLGRAATPTIPMFIGQGANGVLEGTDGSKPSIGAGDGVMIAGDVRGLANQYCADGATVQYTQYDALSHIPSLLLTWTPQALQWINERFAGVPAADTCGAIAPGNSLIPEM